MIARSHQTGRRLAALRQSPIRIPFIGTIEEKAVKTQLLCVIALGLAATATTASAQDNFTVQTSVPKHCATSSTPINPMSVGDLAGPLGFVVTSFASGASFSLPAYYCNTASTVSLTARPLVEPTPIGQIDASSYTNRIDYTANVSWAGVSGNSDESTDTAATPTVYGPTIGDLTISITNPNVRNDTVRPVAGIYTGQVVLAVAVN